jgi:hypothetical protein
MSPHYSQRALPPAPKSLAALGQALFPFPLPGHFALIYFLQQIIRRKSRILMANTKSTTDKAERKKIKRVARKKAAPKPKRTTPRGSQKKKVRKLARGQSKR